VKIAFAAVLLTLVAIAACGTDPTPVTPAAVGELNPGLLATYSDGANSFSLVVTTPSFTLTASQSILPQLARDFTADYTGVIKILQAGSYTFFPDIEIAGKATKGATTLDAGEHAIHLRITKKGDIQFRFEWESTHFKREPVPTRVLSHRGEPDGNFAALERGRAIAEDVNCMACHQGAPATLRGRTGPALDHVGTRVKTPWIAAWLDDRHPRLPTDEIATATAYLASLKDPKDKVKELPTDKFRERQGRELYEQTGCINCHGETLTGLGSKYDAAHLAPFILDPLKVRPSGLMPQPLVNKEEAQLIAEYLVTSRNPQFERPVPRGIVDKGRTIVRERGCLNCHTIEGEQSTLAAPPFASLKGPCKIVHPPITPSAEKDLAAFLNSPRDKSEAPAYDFRHFVERYKCSACHEIDGNAPKVTEPPPSLNDAGNKLRATWLTAVMLQKKRVRPWMGLRMPHFGDAIAPMVNAFAAATGAPLGDGDPITEPTFEQVRDGVKLLGKGDGGLSCIGCHDFAGRESAGTRGPDMTEMASRMRPEWFRRWMRDPVRLQPGTAMPSYLNGKTEAESEALLNGLWAVLAAGRASPLPAGMADKQPFILTVKDEPVVIRTMMPDSATRSIAVGLPGFQSFCFDAEVCSLRYAWTGDFLDIAPTWAGRGGFNANVLGKKWYIGGGALRSDPTKVPAVKFINYRLDGQRVPEFTYEIDGIRIREKITADGDGVVRTFTFNGTVHFPRGEAKGVDIKPSAGEFVDGWLKASGSFTVTVRPKK